MRHDARTLAAGGALALLLCAAGALLDRRAFFASWLAAWWFWIGLGLGAQVHLWIHRLTGGAWIEPIAPALARMRAGLAGVAPLIAPVLLWPDALYPWARDGWIDTAAETAFRQAWLTPAGLGLRVLACIALWTVLTRWRPSGRGARAGFAACGMLLVGYSVSLAATDLLMSLTPRWYSSGFGLLVLTAQLKGAFALALAAGVRQASPAQRNDLGNFLLAYVMTWAYLAFTQFQIVWAENLPAEIAWFVPRMQTGWAWLGIALAAAGFGLPMIALVFRAFKRSRRGLGALAGLLVLMSGLEAVWWVFPSAPGAGIQALWMLPLAIAGMGAVAMAAGRIPSVRGSAAGRAGKERRHA